MARIGMLTPSSNTILEPVTGKLLSGIAGVTAHFSRIRVTQIALDDASSAQFAAEPMLGAAGLLADARVDAIVWNGTSGSWLGLDRDRELCRLLREATGMPATTSALAMTAAYEALGAKRIALVTPYTADVNARIAEGYGRAGLTVPLRLASGLSANEAFANVPAEAIAGMIARAAETPGVDAVAVVCTNFGAAGLAADAERRYGVPVLDSVSVTAWQALRLLGIDGRPLAAEWGRIFEIV
ncbi:maleate cis-trans isomerase family protein [Cohnella nanjingensis]|uniref:Aspartate/glutamate racemase family protein n=1 Tax=Cohnella nanjingensis TaxID=1387779 RepID=A0A7X0RXG6_9BACL|nr:aspartate/glutamate racemase family protein [Cohnella nanjingensis]MBB6675468.1 aspartate/glutamate racemase family protein [Cohnella nanjingensis]